MRHTLFLLCWAAALAVLVSGQSTEEVTVIPTTELPLTTTTTSTSGKRQLKGVTIQNSPFAELQPNGRITGLVTDLMDGIAARVPANSTFSYSLYLSPDGMYGNSFHGRVTGMIGEVVHRRADFAVADLTVTEARSKLVDFSTPFISTHLAALVRRSDVPGLKTIEDLVKFNAGKPTSLEESADRVAYGSFTSGATTFKLSQATDEVAGSIYAWLQANPSYMVPSMKRGLEKVKAGRYAFIVESTFAEHLAGQNCNLTVLVDSGKLYERHFAVALPKGSPLRADFSAAIQSLKDDGTIEGLKRRYWKNNCKEETDKVAEVAKKAGATSNSTEA